MEKPPLTKLSLSKTFSLPSLYTAHLSLPTPKPDLDHFDLDLGLRVGEGLNFHPFLLGFVSILLVWILSFSGFTHQPIWPVFLGVHLRSEVACLSSWLLGFSLSMNFTLGLFLDLSLLIPTHSSPDLSIFFLSNQLFSASGPYHFPSAETYFYGFHAAPWSSNQNGVCPLVKHLVMLQESVHPLGVCLFDPFVDFTNLCVQLVPMVEFIAEDVL